MNQPIVDPNQPQRLQVASVPGSPHEESVMTPDSVPKPADPPPGDPSATEPTPTPEEQELERIASSVITPPNGTPPAETPATPAADPNTDPAANAGGNAPLSLENKVNWAVETLYGLIHGGGNGNGVPASAPASDPAAAPTTGAEDVYNGAFADPNEQVQTDQNAELLEKFNELHQEVNRMQGVVTNVHASQTQYEQAEQARQQAEKNAAEVAKIQTGYNLTPEDAQIVFQLQQRGDYGDAMTYARGKSQVEAASNGAREQREADRNLAGQPSVPGGVSSEPVANQELLEAKLKELNELPPEATKQQRDDLSLWIIANGGMPLLQQQVKTLGREASEPPPQQSIL